MRISAIDAVNLVHLAGAERFVFVQAPEAVEQALPPQHFVQAGDAAAESIGSVEEGGVAIGDLGAELQQFGCGFGVAAALEAFDRTPRPDRPMAEQAANDAARFSLEAEWG